MPPTAALSLDPDVAWARQSLANIATLSRSILVRKGILIAGLSSVLVVAFASCAAFADGTVETGSRFAVGCGMVLAAGALVTISHGLRGVVREAQIVGRARDRMDEALTQYLART